MSKILTIQDYHIPIPEPRSKSEILFINEKKENQKWRRQEDFPDIWYDYNQKTKTFQAATLYDEDGILISLNEKDSLRLQSLLQRENYRRRYGVHAMINGKLIYIAPDYYYNLQWCQMKDLPEKYGRFRFIQNDLMIVYNWIKEIEWIYGLIVAKCKKSGVTQIFSGTYLNESTLYSGWELGAASKEYDHVVDVAMAYFFHAFDNLPFILQPRVKKRNEHEIIFGKPIEDVRSTKVRAKKDTVLNTRVFGAKTKASCFDGPVMRRAWGDEFPKWWEGSKVSPDVAFKKQSETVKIQQKKNGLLIYTSYMPEVVDRGFMEFRKIYKDSKLSKRSREDGPTQTGLIPFFMSGIDSNEDCFDEYGYCDRRKALMILNAENDSKADRESKLAHRKQYPRDENDAFESGGTSSTFNNLRLADCYREVDEAMSAGKKIYSGGVLRWKNSAWESGDVKRPEGSFCEVYFEEWTDDQRLHENKEDLFKFFQPLREELLNQVLRKNSKNLDNGFYCPLDDYIGVGSFDPTDYKLKSDVKVGSTNVGHSGYIEDPKLNVFGINGDDLFSEYAYRHENPDDTLEDVIKFIIFTGFYMIIEANKGWVITRLKDENLQNFLLLRDEKGNIRPYQEGDENKLVNTDANMIETYCRAINRYWAEPRPGGNKIDRMKTSPSLKVYEQAMTFDPTDTKRFDYVVSYGYWRVGIEVFTVYIYEQRKKNDYDGGVMKQIVSDLLD